jgi:hypothetical protein
MPDREADHSSTSLPRRPVSWPLLATAAALILMAWVCAHVPWVGRVSSLNDVSADYNLMTSNALPWFLQRAGVICGILGWCGTRNQRGTTLFAILVSLTLAILWWGGLAIKFQGMGVLKMITEVMKFEIQSDHGSSLLSDEVLFHFIGPILGPLQLHGPDELHGWNFLFIGLSTTLLVGYLRIVGRMTPMANGSSSAIDYIQFIAAILLCFVPPLIRLVFPITTAG